MKTVNLNIDKFLGLHTDALGDTELKVGELSDMKNFKITEGYNIEKRTGYAGVLNSATGQPIRGQWYGRLNGSDVHLFASDGHVYKNNGDGTTTDLGTLTDAPTSFFQFEDTQPIRQRRAGTSAPFGYSATLATKLAQTFTPLRTMRLTSIEIALSVFDHLQVPADAVQVSLYNTSAGLPTTLIATAKNTVAGSALPTNDTYNVFSSHMFYFDEVTLTVNTQYALVVERTGTFSATRYYLMPSTSSSLYSGGTAVTYNNTTWTANASSDFWFGVYGKAEYSIYIQNGVEYKKWTGYGSISDVTGYVPIIVTGANPTTGVGVTNETLNSLTGQRRVFYNGNNSTVTYKLPQANITSVDFAYINGIGASSITTNLLTGTVTFTVPPNTGIDNVEIVYTVGADDKSEVLRKTNYEFYGGKNDTRIFLYGNDATLIYSGLADGVPSAEYFPVLNYIRVGAEETKVTALERQYDRLIVFKETDTWWLTYEYTSLIGVEFPVYPLNDTIGCSVVGQSRLIQNNPFVVFGKKVYQFVASNVRDERNVAYMSNRIQPLLDAETMTGIITFDYEAESEYWIIIGKEVYIYNYEFDVWYYYYVNDTITSICFTDKLTIGTSGGQLMKFGGQLTDNGTAIDAYFKTGFMDYGTTIYRKFVNFIWLQLYLDGNDSTADFYYQTDKDSETLVKELDYTTQTNPKAIRLKPKMKKFVVGKFIIKNNTTTRCRVLNISAPAIIGGISK